MSRPPDDFAMRKQLLAARSSLCRLRLRHDAWVLRESFTVPRLGASVVRSPAARTAAFLVAVEIAGPTRMARLLAFANQALSIARIAGIALAWLRDRQAGSAESSERVTPPPP